MSITVIRMAKIQTPFTAFSYDFNYCAVGATHHCFFLKVAQLLSRRCL